MKIDWHELREMAGKKFDGVPDGSGIYFLRWSKNEKAASIGRLGDLDVNGVLYVGSAKKLKRRVRQLWRGINGKVWEHTIGRSIIFCRIFDLIDLSEYELTWEETQTHQDAIEQEWNFLKLYADKYKEPPPLNLAIRREFLSIWDLGKWDKSRWANDPDEFVKTIANS